MYLRTLARKDQIWQIIHQVGLLSTVLTTVMRTTSNTITSYNANSTCTFVLSLVMKKIFYVYIIYNHVYCTVCMHVLVCVELYMYIHALPILLFVGVLPHRDGVSEAGED